MGTLNDILNSILIIGIVQGFIFNGVLWYKNRPVNKAIRFLNLTIFFFSLSNLQSFAIKKDWVSSKYLIHGLIDLPWSIFIAPLFFLFLIHYLQIKKAYKKLYFITFFLFIGFALLRFYLLAKNKLQLDSVHFEQFMRKFNIYEDIVVLAFTISVFLYCVFLFYILKNSFKYINSFNNLKWLHVFYKFTGIILLLWLIAIVLDATYPEIKTASFYTPLRFVTSFVIYWLGYQGYNQYLLTKDRISLRTAIANDVDFFKTPEIEPEFDEKEKAIFDGFKKQIITEKLYLNPNLSLESLALELKTNPSTLSKIVNNYSKNSFSDFINMFRVTYAKNILLNKKFDAYTIISIGLECGFNSKSTFYTAFKRFSGETPVNFRKNNKSC